MASVKNTFSEIFPVISRNRNNILNSETQIVNNVYLKIRQVKVQNIRATLITHASMVNVPKIQCLQESSLIRVNDEDT